MAVEVLEVQIKGTSTGFDKVVSGASSALSGLANIGKTVLVAGLAAGTAAVGLLATGLGVALKEAMEAQEGMAQLDAVLKSTGGAAGVTRDMALELADGLSQVTRFSDDAILAGENLLLTFTNIGADVFPRATETMLDMATALGTDASGGAIQLGKALNDPIAGITALTRVGVTFTEEQKDAIASMVEMGDIAGAQTIILDELAKEFGGSAEAAGQTFAGQLDILKNSLLNVAEGVGMALLPVLQTFMNDVMIPLLPIIQEVANAFVFMFQAIMDGDPGLAFDNLREAIFSIGSQLGISEEALLSFNLKLTELWDWITGTAIPVLQDWGAWLGEKIPLAIATVQEGLTVFGEWLQGDGKAGWDEFLLSLEPIITGFQGLYTAFVENLPIMQENAQLFATWFSESFGPVITQVIENIKSIFNSLVTATGNDLTQMSGFWNTHGETVIGIVTTAFQVITTTIGGAITIISGLVSAWLLLWQGDTQGALDTLQNTFNTFFESVLSLVGTNATEFQTVWTGTFELIALAFNTWKDQLLLDFSTWILNFLNTWQTNWDQFSLIVETIIDNIVGFFLELKQTIGGVIAEVKNLIDKILDIPGIPGSSSGGNTNSGHPGTNIVAGGSVANQTIGQGETVADLLARGDLLGAMELARQQAGGGGFAPSPFTGGRGGRPGEGTATSGAGNQFVLNIYGQTVNAADVLMGYDMLQQLQRM